jgi:hypothetical protein
MFDPEIFNETITTADTEYSKELPAGTCKFQIRLQDGTAFRLAFVTGKVATPTPPYLSVPAGHSYEEICDSRRMVTLYFAAPAGTKVAEISCWKGA